MQFHTSVEFTFSMYKIWKSHFFNKMWCFEYGYLLCHNVWNNYYASVPGVASILWNAVTSLGENKVI